MEKQKREDELRRFYHSPTAVNEYAGAEGLHPVEARIFDRYVPAGGRVLDLGVGCGRTTPFLSERASYYLGVDFSEPLLEVCRRRHPDLDWLCADAADLTVLAGRSFDAIVFSHNGIDALPSDEARMSCLRECRRLLDEGGTLIVARDNPRGIITPLGRQALAGVRGVDRMKAVGFAVKRTLRGAARVLPQAAFWRGEGYLTAGLLRGVPHASAVPRFVVAEADAVGLRMIETAGTHVPPRRGNLRNMGFVYVFVPSRDIG